MQAYTATPGVGQWISRAVETSSSSLTAMQSRPYYPVFKLVWQQVVIGEPNLVDEQALAQLYAEFADEDRAMAKLGISDYARLLANEDKDA